MEDTMDKSLEELRAAVEADIEAESAEEAGTQSEVESTQDASEEGTSKEASSEDPDEGTSEEEEEWVVPGRFKTYEDVLKAYKELESFTGSQSSEIQKLRSAIKEPPRRGESPEEKEARLTKFAEELAADPEKALEERMLRLLNKGKEEIKQREFKQIYEARATDPNSDFAELEPVMTQIATKYGDMIQANDMHNDPRILDILYLAAKGVQANEIASKANSEGIKKGKELSRQKNKARIESPSGKISSKKIDTTKLSSAQMKEALLKGDLDFSE